MQMIQWRLFVRAFYFIHISYIYILIVEKKNEYSKCFVFNSFDYNLNVYIFIDSAKWEEIKWNERKKCMNLFRNDSLPWQKKYAFRSFIRTARHYHIAHIKFDVDHAFVLCKLNHSLRYCSVYSSAELRECINERNDKNNQVYAHWTFDECMMHDLIIRIEYV